jgi:hypothetical protein
MIRFAMAGRVGLLVFPAAFLAAQGATDFSVLRINEVIADNSEVDPVDVAGSTTDMIEIFNPTDEALDIGGSLVDPEGGLALTDTKDLPPADSAIWKFPPGTRILAKGSLIIFADANLSQGQCELHAGFQIASDGTEPISLWGPERDDTRALIDQVWLPPLPPNVSFGRSPDGAGPAPVPLESVKDTFVYFPPGQATLGSCFTIPTPCGPGLSLKIRHCDGDPNGPGDNLDPRVERSEYTTNAPAAGEAVEFTVRVEDDQDPLPGNITKVEVVFRVNGGPEQTVPLVYDMGGLHQGTYIDGMGQEQVNPFDVWTLWTGTIPGQPAGSRVEFFFRVEDAQGGSDTSPETICPDGMGPCHREFGGPGCQKDALDTTCSNPEFTGERYVECSARFTYTVGYTPRPEVAGLVINEVCARQDGLLKDPTEGICDPEEEDPELICPPGHRNCCQFRDDWIELLNTSSAPVNLSGLWLSSSPFGPESWQFPQDSEIPPGQYLIVWLDNDGAKCPDPNLPEEPCFWECPDPTDTEAGQYHSSFSLNTDGDQIYLFDAEAHGFGVIHGVEFGPQELNHSLALTPDGNRSGAFVDSASPTPASPNVPASFKRGDSDGNCGLDISDPIGLLNFLFSGGDAISCPDAGDADDNGRLEISDAIYVLNFLFLGQRPPVDPGPTTPGDDPTLDALGPCITACT